MTLKPSSDAGPAPRNGSRSKTPNSRPSRPAARGDLSKVKERLTELLGTLSMGQAGLAAITGNPQHGAGAQVTDAMTEPIVDAWIKLAQENDAVKQALMKLTTGGALGEVILITAVFGICQGQVYGKIPQLPISFMPEGVEIPVPPSDDVREHAESVGEPAFVVRAASMPPEQKALLAKELGLDPNDENINVKIEAELQRLATEKKRAER